MNNDLDYSPWTEKVNDKLLWRGSTTGASWIPGVDVRRGQRQRLVKLMNRTDEVEVMFPSNGKFGREVQQVNSSALADTYLDVGFAGKPCRECPSNLLFVHLNGSLGYCRM